MNRAESSKDECGPIEEVSIVSRYTFPAYIQGGPSVIETALRADGLSRLSADVARFCDILTIPLPYSILKTALNVQHIIVAINRPLILPLLLLLPPPLYWPWRYQHLLSLLHFALYWLLMQLLIEVARRKVGP